MLITAGAREELHARGRLPIQRSRGGGGGVSHYHINCFNNLGAALFFHHSGFATQRPTTNDPTFQQELRLDNNEIDDTTYAIDEETGKMMGYPLLPGSLHGLPALAPRTKRQR
mmetsp:Transcript_106676/g.309416  ORF Transcript_106676/g.309416 Transcript_106676/m.309416 type:complete len:113 (+) Transcript_106676:625-963(+)